MMSASSNYALLLTVLAVTLAAYLSDAMLFKSAKVDISRYSKILTGNYGNWCGKRNTWLKEKNENGCCKCTDSLAKCRWCKRPIDDLDDACLQHDFCVHCNRTGIKFQHLCECEELISKMASSAYCVEGSVSPCGIYRAAVIGLFKHIPCRCRRNKACDISLGFKTIDNTPCMKFNYHNCLH